MEELRAALILLTLRIFKRSHDPLDPELRLFRFWSPFRNETEEREPAEIGLERTVLEPIGED
jgi:hypothetical protein